MNFDNIKIYNVPKNIDLEINGWGTGKFTNNQYFGSNSLGVNTNGNNLSDFLVRILGSYQYSFEIHVKKDNWGYEFGYTHLFKIPKKKETFQDNDGNKTTLETRMLLLLDMSYDGNEDPSAFWDCYDE